MKKKEKMLLDPFPLEWVEDYGSIPGEPFMWLVPKGILESPSTKDWRTVAFAVIYDPEILTPKGYVSVYFVEARKDLGGRFVNLGFFRTGSIAQKEAEKYVIGERR